MQQAAKAVACEVLDTKGVAMSGEIIELSQYRKCKAATGPDTFQGVRLPQEDVINTSNKPFGVPYTQNCVLSDHLNDAELHELNSIFQPQIDHRAATRHALFTEAMEQAHIEMNGGPVDLSAFPSYKLDDYRSTDREIRVQQLKLMVQRTGQLLREYLEAYRSLR